MLTKNLLRFTKRSDRIYPHYIKPNDPETLSFVESLDKFYRQSVGYTVVDMQKKRELVFGKAPSYAKAFFKLADSSLNLEEDDADIEHARWDLIALSKELRHKVSEHPAYGYSDFQGELVAAAEKDWESLQKSFYADLAERKVIENYSPVPLPDMIHRYNCAQVQGLLMHASNLDVSMMGLKLTEKRSLVQKLKFHRLLAEIEVSGERLRMQISGPLSISDGSQGYGSRFANFFPYILNSKEWTLKAQLRLNRSDYDLVLDPKRQWKTHYQSVDRYLPAEFEKFIESFNKKGNQANSSSWVASACSDFVHLGEKSMCFPDIKLERRDKKTAFMEIFHRWHKGQLDDRLRAILEKEHQNYLLAVCSSIKLSQSAEHLLKELNRKNISIIRFRSFPSVKAVLAYLGE